MRALGEKLYLNIIRYREQYNLSIRSLAVVAASLVSVSAVTGETEYLSSR